FAAAGLAPFRPRWAALHAYAGREVVLLEQGRELARGIATGIDAQGPLLLDTAEGPRAIAAGDGSLRPPAALSSACPAANLTDTLAAVLDPLATALEHFAAAGLAPFRPRWAALHAYAGREVVLLEQGRELARGIATGID
ncbi:hypothetical protein F3J10_36035, partial [Burkholderia sp. Cy-637]|nr:hypothetical protein [Burkholderia sp. Cy-637]